MRMIKRDQQVIPGILVFACVVASGMVAWAPALGAQGQAVPAKLEGLDAFVDKVLKDWNAAGVAVGVVVKDKLVFAKGYGYRDYDQKLPMTPQTLFQIASNTKLFTAVAVGMLVNEGKLDWDKPVRRYVPSIQFYSDDLNNTVTIRDMLSHRTGITRHDLIWYRADLSRKDLFLRLKYLEPVAPLRQTYLYNNLMYAASGYVIESLTGQTWEDFVRERIFRPLEMNATVFTVAEMKKYPDHAVPYKEKRDSTELMPMPYYEDTAGMAPCGAIISNIEDMSRWLIARMNEGRYAGRQTIPPEVLKATAEPAIAQVNTDLEARGYEELLNPIYGMGCSIASYRGHAYIRHGGALPGFLSQVSLMPRDGIGVLVFVIGDHCGMLPDVIAYGMYERWLGLDPTPWNERRLESRTKGKAADQVARSKVGSDRVAHTQPSHPLSDFVGAYEHPAYGTLTIGLKDDQLQFDFHNIQLPLTHYHYDRFDTPDDELWGKWSVNFSVSPQGTIDTAAMSLDEAAVTFTRKVDAGLRDPHVLDQYVGDYEDPTGGRFRVIRKEDTQLIVAIPGQPQIHLIPAQPRQFRVQEAPDWTFEFLVENGVVKSLRIIMPAGEYDCPRK